MGKLNPGSPEAVAAGCLCPIIDNHHGKGVPIGKDGSPLFWRSERCPIHGGEALTPTQGSKP